MRMFDTKYAIIEIASKQFMVQEGDKVKVFAADITSFDTLLIKDEKTLEIGTPAIEKGGVTLNYVGDKKVKTVVRRYKGKSRYRVNKSHTDIYSVFAVSSIKVGDENSITKMPDIVEEPKKEEIKKVIKKEG